MLKLGELVAKKKSQKGVEENEGLFVHPGHGVAGKKELLEYPGNIGQSVSYAFGNLGYKNIIEGRKSEIEKVSDEYLNKTEREIERLYNIAYNTELSEDERKKAFDELEGLIENRGGKKKKQRKSKKNLRRKKRKSNKRKTK